MVTQSFTGDKICLCEFSVNIVAPCYSVVKLLCRESFNYKKDHYIVLI